METVERRTKRWTRDEVRSLVSLGVLGTDDRLELLEGELVEKMTQYAPHMVAIQLVTEWANRLSPTTCNVRVQGPIALNDLSEPEPDVAVVPGNPRDYLGDHPRPEQVLFLVEVSDTTLRDDRKRKVPLYARAGISEVWILDLNGRRLIVHTEPEGDEYRLVRTLLPDESVAPSFHPESAVLVRDLLP